MLCCVKANRQVLIIAMLAALNEPSVPSYCSIILQNVELPRLYQRSYFVHLIDKYFGIVIYQGKTETFQTERDKVNFVNKILKWMVMASMAMLILTGQWQVHCVTSQAVFRGCSTQYSYKVSKHHTIVVQLINWLISD